MVNRIPQVGFLLMALTKNRLPLSYSLVWQLSF